MSFRSIDPRSPRRSLGARLIIFLFVAITCVTAAPLECDLGEGLVYYRLHTLPADLPSAAATPRPMVLDLRFTAANEGSADQLQAWLDSRATRATPVIVLVNAETPRTLHPAFAALASRAGFITIGSPATGFVPDLTIAAPPDAERRAYEALEQGASLESLIRQNADKPRFDEAAIMRERANPPEDIPDDELTDAPPETKAEPASPPSPALVDLALQRAVQLHRALVALKRI